MTTQYNQGPSVRPAGESNPEFAKAVSDYMKQFHCSISLDKYKIDKMEMYKWCSANLGEKYKDWFLYEGGSRDKTWVLHIRSPRKSTFFRLKWNDVIQSSVDIVR